MAASVITCPSCTARLRLSGPPAPGRSLRCPHCGHVFALATGARPARRPARDEDDAPPAPARAGGRSWLPLVLVALGGLVLGGGLVAGLLLWLLRPTPSPTAPADRPLAVRTDGAKTAEPPPPETKAADKPAGEKPPADKPVENKPTGDKPTADKPAADKPAADKPAAPAARQQLVGRWERDEEGQKVSFEFAADGSLLLGGMGPGPIKGTYRWAGDDAVAVEFQVPGGPTVRQTLKVAVTPDGLTTTDERNQVERFARAKAGAPATPGETAGKPSGPPPGEPLTPGAGASDPPPAAPAPTPFTAPEQGFRVGMPGETKHTDRPSKVGRAHTFVAEAKEGPPVSYQVVCTDLPPGAPPRAVLDEVAGAFAPRTVKDRKAVTLQGHPGTEFTLELEQGGLALTMAQRAYVANNRLYHLIVTSPRGAVGPDAARAFFDSFQLLGGPAVAGKPPVKPPVLPPAEPPARPIPSLAARPLPRPATDAESLKGETKEVIDLQVTEVNLSPETTLGCLCWADEKGTAFYSLDGSGAIRRVSFPELQQTWKLELPQKASWLSVSGAGLLVSVPGQQEVWLLDPATGAMKQRYPVPRLQRAVSAAGQDVAVASNGEGLTVLDLKKAEARPYRPRDLKLVGFDRPVMTPDGKYVFTTGMLESMHRFALDKGQLRFEQSSPRLAQGVVDIGVQVSPDSKRVCYPSFAGNYNAGKYGAVFVYPVADITKPEFTFEPGPGCQAVGFDPVAHHVYGTALRLFDDRGQLLKDYPLHKPPLPTLKQILVHPGGHRLLLFTGERVAAVEVPKF